ncbi:MAG: acyl carrier protein [Nocardia sp.]|nr:acyl carrier protein [Nocardia sp.]
MNDDEVRTQVRRLVARLAPEPGVDPVSSDALRDGLGFDSLTLIGLALSIKKQFGVDVRGDARAVDVVTVGDVEDLVVSALAGLRTE